MTEQEIIKKAINHFENMRAENMAVLWRGFGKNEGENNLLYINRKMYAEAAIKALEKLKTKKPILEYQYYMQVTSDTWHCPSCGERYNTDYDAYHYCPNCGQAIMWDEKVIIRGETV